MYTISFRLTTLNKNVTNVEEKTAAGVISFIAILEKRKQQFKVKSSGKFIIPADFGKKIYKYWLAEDQPFS